ncbi:MAG: fused MFS/spermidine synthase, partial [Phycisphaerae bacterium]|nr:fused MFS/spermidine synthase [Phycisphaerae bacterium]
QRIAAAQRVRWVLCALVPSSLLLGVTSHITTNLAAAPLLWVIPLATYLLTFVLVFARKPPLSHTLMVRLFPFVVVLSAPLFFVTLTGLEIRVLVFHLVMFFVAAMLCHGELVRTRPDPRHLTEFYLWIAVGGLCGGMLNTLLAPLLFTNVIEYPLMMVAACALRPPAGPAANRPGYPWLDWVGPLLLAAFALGLVAAFRAIGWGGTWLGVAILYVTTGAACLVLRKRPTGFALGYAAALLALSLHVRVGEGRQLHAARNFFGVKRVVASDNGALHSLYHGTTVHGMQRPGLRYGREPLAYYHRGGPFDDVLDAARMRSAPLTAGLVGLGAGALAAYAERGDHFTFYELDPGVADIAANPRFFTYLRDCQGTVDVVLGDARRMLANAADGQFDLLVLDAYSSDAIPTHLLSREAMQLYVSKVTADGVLAFHITNRFLDLQPVLARLAEDAGLTCLIREETSDELSEAAQAFGAQRAVVVVIARKPDAFGLLVDHAKWRQLPRSPDTPLWTDEYSSVLSVLHR